jgi:glucose-1-phosphate thymidylyltransferase
MAADVEKPIVSRIGCAIAAAVVPTEAIVDAQSGPLIDRIEDVCNGAVVPVEMASMPFSLFDYPHDIIRDNLEHFSSNLAERIRTGDYREIQPGVFCHGDPQISELVVMDTRSGPIVMEEGVSIGPFTLLEGPIYIGRNCRIIEHAAIKDCVSLGPTTKIGGEVEASVIESYTNKQHHGFLGHSYLGSWINLGAGTCNSDLKNTYGKVNMEYGGKKVSTGMRFVGCVIGDFAKTAINTSIFTGKTIGACSMVYGFVTTNVPSFVNYARSFGQTTELPPAVMQSTQQRMFERRDVEQRPADIELIAEMYRATAEERQLSEEPLNL